MELFSAEHFHHPNMAGYTVMFCTIHLAILVQLKRVPEFCKSLLWNRHLVERFKGPIISEDICGIFQLPKKYSVFLSLACWLLSFEFSRTFLESVSKSWGFQLSPRGLNSDFQWIWQMICLICWWNYQKCTHFVVIHNNTFSNFKFWIVQDRNLEYFLGYMKNDLHFLKESHL